MEATKPNHVHGAACSKGHGTLRYRSGGECVECRRVREKAGRQLQNIRSARWRAKNPDREHQRYRRWETENPEKVAIVRGRRAKREREAEGVFTDADAAALHDRQKGLCRFFEVCGNRLGEVYARDHIAPLIKGGSHWPANRQLLCLTCNSRKGFKDQDAFLAEIGLASCCALAPFSTVGQFPRP